MGGLGLVPGCCLGDGARAAGACISVPVSERALSLPGPCVQQVFPPSGLLPTWGLWGVSQPLGGRHLRGPSTQHGLAHHGTLHLQTLLLPGGATLQAGRAEAGGKNRVQFQTWQQSEACRFLGFPMCVTVTLYYTVVSEVCKHICLKDKYIP